jgi:putative flippase GtrA
MVVGRFFTVGLACALLHNAIMIAGAWLGAHYIVSSLVSFAVVVLFGYWLHTTWTWPRAERDRVSLARYTLTMSANLPVFIAGMFVFVDLAGIGVPIAAPLVTVLLMAFNFFGSRWALKT